MVVVYSYGCPVVTCLNNEGTPICRGQIPSEMCVLEIHNYSIRCIF